MNSIKKIKNTAINLILLIFTKMRKLHEIFRIGLSRQQRTSVEHSRILHEIQSTIAVVFFYLSCKFA
jgi:hypothetical protein